MKKRTKILILTAVLMIAIGGSGSIYFYQKISQNAHQSFTMTYQPKQTQTKLLLKKSGSTQLTIQPSPDNKFHLKGNYLNITHTPRKAYEWHQKENKEATEMNLKLSRLPENDVPFFNIWPSENNRAILQVPKHYQTIEIASQNGGLTLKKLKTAKMSLDLTNSSFLSIVDNQTDDLDIKQTYGSVQLERTTAKKKITIQGNGLDITVQKTDSPRLGVRNHIGDINLTGNFNETNIHSTEGNISAKGNFGKNKMASRDGQIRLAINQLDNDHTLRTVYAPIYVAFLKTPSNFNFELQTKTGETQIFEENIRKKQVGKKKYKLDAFSDEGDIYLYDYTKENVDWYEDWQDEYYQDEDDWDDWDDDEPFKHSDSDIDADHDDL